ncbi:MAG: tape measure protein [Paracoccus sp. (in: a-proteobacteria)]|nr:tape measure protein [Paracoccus sp. (in: a-proteobacteria)]
MDIATLGLAIRSDGVVVASDRLRGLGKSAGGAEAAIDRLFGRSNVLMAAFKRLAVAAGGVFAVRGLVNMADTWSDLSSRVGLAVGDMSKAQEVMGRLSEMADRSYSSLELTAESWLSNATALRELGMSTSQSLAFIEALNNALVVSGAKGQHAASVMDAVSKAMALGTLRGDNLNTVIQRGGRRTELLAEEMGVTTTELRRLGAEGKLTGEVMSRAWAGNLDTLREELEKMPTTVADGFLRIRNAILQLVGGADQIGGVSAAVAELLVNISNGIKAMIPLVNAAATRSSGIRSSLCQTWPYQRC